MKSMTGFEEVLVSLNKVASVGTTIKSVQNLGIFYSVNDRYKQDLSERPSLGSLTTREEPHQCSEK